MGHSAPDSVILTAAKALQKKEPASKLANLLAFAGSGDQTAPLPEDCSVPLFLLRYLYERNVVIPKGRVLIDQQDEASNAFWIYMLAKGAGEAEKLLNLPVKHGDSGIQNLVRAVHGPLCTDQLLRGHRDVYESVLIRLRFSALNNEHVLQKCENVLGSPTRSTGHRTLTALIDCKRFTLADQNHVRAYHDLGLKVVIDKLCQLKNSNLHGLLRECIKCWTSAPRFLRRLIHRGADDALVRLVWDALQSTCLRYGIKPPYCLPPLAGLERFTLEHDVSADDAQSMLSTLEEVPGFGARYSKAVMTFFAAVFWRAPENVLEHFLDLVPADEELDNEEVWGLLLLEEYSREFLGKLSVCQSPMNDKMCVQISKCRPGLVEELGLSTPNVEFQ